MSVIVPEGLLRIILGMANIVYDDRQNELSFFYSIHKSDWLKILHT